MKFAFIEPAANAIARGGMTIRFEKLATAKQIFDAIFP
jgi:hypothetical protein